MKIFDNYPKKVKIRDFFIENFACPKRRFSANCLSKRQAEWVLAKFLPIEVLNVP